jgi:hypothetical protein
MADKLSNTGIGTPDAEIAAACLTEYIQGFQKRNPLTVEQYKEYAKIIEQVEKKNGEVAQLDEQAEYAGSLLKHREELERRLKPLLTSWTSSTMRGTPSLLIWTKK